jgi:hypothetical protein
MATSPATTSDAPTPTNTPVLTPRPVKSFSVRMTSPAGEFLTFYSRVMKRTGHVQTRAVFKGVKTEGIKRVVKPGATAVNPDMAAARVHVDKLVLDAQKLGWILKPQRGGFARQPDQFDLSTLPKPNMTPATPKPVALFPEGSPVGPYVQPTSKPKSKGKR